MRKKRCCHCRQIIIVPISSCRRRRRRRKRTAGANARIDQSTSVNGPVSGLINIIVQVPINAGDSTALNESDNNSVTNVV